MTLDTKTKELVAIGSSIAANCQPCLKYHLKIAKDSGATEEEIKDAMEIGCCPSIALMRLVDS